MKTVMIKIDDQGQISVGEMPMEGEAEGGMPGKPGMSGMGAKPGMEMDMQPAKSIGEALQIAGKLLSGGQQSPDEAKGSLMAGYNKAGNRPMPGGMGM